MMSRANKPIDVFKLIDMVNGPEWTDPETGEVSRCWLFTGKPNSEGRPYIQVDGKKLLAYRVVYELVTGIKLGANIWRHKCDRGLCCNPKHGLAGNHDENMDDMKSRERHGMPHHTVRMIRKCLANGIPIDVVAHQFGTSATTVRDIESRKNYAHVTDEETTQ
jgi:hypothetical protein